MSTVESPCISICVLDEKDVCQGCYRTAHEITQWRMATDEERQQILVNSRIRRRLDQTVILK